MIKSRKVHDWKVRCHQWPCCCCCKNIWIKVPISQWKYPKRVFCHVQSKARESQKKKRPIASNLRGHQPRGHLPLLGSLDQMIEKFLLALRSRGGLITLVIAVCVVKKKTHENNWQDWNPQWSRERGPTFVLSKERGPTFVFTQYCISGGWS